MGTTGKFIRLLLLALSGCILVHTQARSQEVKQIEIINADLMEHDESLGPGVIKCLGNVQFKQEDMLMDCDSAYFYGDENRVNAWNNIHIHQADTLHLYGDQLEYLGDIKLAKFRRNVILIDKESTLQTEYLDFDRINDVGYYINGGTISSGENILRSKTGHYFSAIKMAHFRDSVVITNPDYTIYSDTLRYHTETEIAYFEGPTEIISEGNYIYCENGWYDTEKDISQFNKNAYLESKGQFLRGDSLYYERNLGLGKAFDNVELFDSAQDILLRGSAALYIEDPEYALLTDSAEFILIDGEDSLFVHADTLESMLDTSGMYKIIKAYYKVKIFRYDLQGKCDSLVYLEQDSVFELHSAPVLWSDENQLTAEFIKVHMANKKLDYIDFTRNSFIISQEDSIRFNQIKGRNMTGYFTDNKITNILVKGNGQALYFIDDVDEEIGVNKAESTNIMIYMEENKIDRINMLIAPEGTIYPPDYLKKNELYLTGFTWLQKHRPLKKDDIFIWEE